MFGDYQTIRLQAGLSISSISVAAFNMANCIGSFWLCFVSIPTVVPVRKNFSSPLCLKSLIINRMQRVTQQTSMRKLTGVVAIHADANIRSTNGDPWIFRDSLLSLQRGNCEEYEIANCPQVSLQERSCSSPIWYSPVTD